MNYKYINTDISKELYVSPNQVYLEDYLAEFDTEPSTDNDALENDNELYY